MIISYESYPYCTFEGLQAVHGQVAVLRDMKLNSIADNMERMASDLQVLLSKLVMARQGNGF